MAIDKTAITMVATHKGLTMKRKYLTFEANRENEFIKVIFEQWLETATEDIVEYKIMHYITKDIPAITEMQDLDGDGVVETLVTISPAFLGFTNWHDYIISSAMVNLKLGADIIVGAINNTLKTKVPADAKDGYIIQS